MSKVYETRPPVVKVTAVDEDGAIEERHVVGYTLTEVIEAVTLGLDGAEPKPLVAKKTHKRRTKAEIAAAQPAALESAPAHAAAADRKAWPD